MSDKDQNDDFNEDFDEDFDFLDQDDATSSSTDTSSEPDMPATKTGMDKSKQKHILIAAVATVIGLGSFYLVSKSKSQSQFNQPKKPPTVVAKHPVSTPDPAKPQQSKLFEDLIESAKGPSVANASIEELRGAIQVLNDDLASNITQIRQLQATLEEMYKAISLLNNNINLLDNRFTNLTTSVGTLKQDVGKVKQIIKDEDLDLSSNAANDQTLTYESPEYTVHAVIPGRAWLKHKNNTILTVKEGDKLGKYGTITIIDHINSMVLTSSGVTLR